MLHHQRSTRPSASATKNCHPQRRPPSLARARTHVVCASAQDGNSGRDPFAARAAPPSSSPSSSSEQQQQQQPPVADPDLLPEAMRPFGRKTWMWRGHRCSYVTAGCGPVSVVLVHGFGASSTQYRRLFQTLIDHGGYKVYAFDSLGFGSSAMPLPEEASETGGKHFYRLELWRDQIADFCEEFCGSSSSDDDSAGNSPGPVLVGNSVGSLACLMAASGPVRARGVALLNSSGALNNKGVVSDWRIVVAYPIFLLVDALLSYRPLARLLFDKVRDPETLSNVLKAAYGDSEGGQAVDDELVSLIAGPASRDNALDVFVDVVTSPHYGPKPWEVIPAMRKKGTPLLVAWGTEDKLTPLDGPVGQYFKALAEESEEEQLAKGGKVTFALLPGHGHCPHDDPRPTLARDHLLPWLAGLGGGAEASTKGAVEREVEAAAAAPS